MDHRRTILLEELETESFKPKIRKIHHELSEICWKMDELEQQQLNLEFDFINLYKKRKLTGRIHILGMSAGLAMQIMAYTGIFEQWDSANWRVKSFLTKRLNHNKPSEYFFLIFFSHTENFGITAKNSSIQF